MDQALESSDERSQRMSEEAAFIRARPHLPSDREFATMLRSHLIASDLPWTQENLHNAAAEVLPRYRTALRRASLLRNLRSVS